MKKQIIDFTELKAYCDIFNERGHKGYKDPINPFFWWNHKWSGRVDDAVHAYIDDGLVIIFELENKNSLNVDNMQIFALCPQANILKKIVDIARGYDKIVFNSDKLDRYKSIVKRIDGTGWTDGRYYYAAHGGHAWLRLYGRQ